LTERLKYTVSWGLRPYNVVEICQSFGEPTESILFMEAAGSSERVDKTVPDYTPPHFYSHGHEYVQPQTLCNHDAHHCCTCDPYSGYASLTVPILSLLVHTLTLINRNPFQMSSTVV